MAQPSGVDGTTEPRPHRLASLQSAGRLGPILTQNIDGLHQRAGAGR